VKALQFDVLDVIKAIGFVAFLAIAWVAIPIAGVLIGITLAVVIIFHVILDHFKSKNQE